MKNFRQANKVQVSPQKKFRQSYNEKLWLGQFYQMKIACFQAGTKINTSFGNIVLLISDLDRLEVGFIQQSSLLFITFCTTIILSNLVDSSFDILPIFFLALIFALKKFMNFCTV